MSVAVTIIPVLGDHMNYAYLLEADNGETAIIDPGEAGPVIEELERRNLSLTYVINTHHHWDHTDGNEALIKKYGAQLAGPENEQHVISGLNITLSEQKRFMFGSESVQTLLTPGHTAGHICLYFPDSKLLFTGDALFLMGCGRLFEGTAKEAWLGLKKLLALPDDTLIYCGHEYTRGNAGFCLKIEPDNESLKQRIKHVKTLTDQRKPTVPATLKEEKETNVFLRAGSMERYAQLRELRNKY